MSQQELCQKSQEEVCEKKERKITTLPAKYLRYMSFAHWFLKELKLEEGVYNDLISKIPQDISQQISFLNPFIDFESLHQKQFKTFTKDRNAQIKAQLTADAKALKANTKAQLKAFKSFLSKLNNDPQAKNIFSSNHPQLLPLLNTHNWKPHHDLLPLFIPFLELPKPLDVKIVKPTIINSKMNDTFIEDRPESPDFIKSVIDAATNEV